MGRKKGKRFVSAVKEWIKKAQPIPAVLADRVLKLGLLSFFMLILGCFFARELGASFLSASLTRCVYLAAQAALLYRRALKKEYETVEGTVRKVTGRHKPGRFLKVVVEKKDGEEATLLLDKGRPLEVGETYRFYFSNRQQAFLGVKNIDAALHTNAFYGFERIE